MNNLISAGFEAKSSFTREVIRISSFLLRKNKAMYGIFQTTFLQNYAERHCIGFLLEIVAVFIKET